MSQIKNDNDKVEVKKMTRYNICMYFAYICKRDIIC